MASTDFRKPSGNEGSIVPVIFRRFKTTNFIIFDLVSVRDLKTDPSWISRYHLYIMFK